MQGTLDLDPQGLIGISRGNPHDVTKAGTQNKFSAWLGCEVDHHRPNSHIYSADECEADLL